MYNYFLLVGYVARDFELKEVGDGKKVVALTLAVQRDFLNNEGSYSTDYFRITCWEFLAEVAMNVLTKGSKVAIKGRMVTKKTEDKESGNVYYSTELYGERIIAFSNKANYDKANKKELEEENKEENEPNIEEI